QVCAKFFRDVVIVALHGGIASGHQINISFRVLLGGVFTVLSAIMLLCLLGCCQRSAHTLTVSSPWGLPVFIVWYGKCPGVSPTREHDRPSLMRPGKPGYTHTGDSHC